jgi:hypothetical protein
VADLYARGHLWIDPESHAGPADRRLHLVLPEDDRHFLMFPVLSLIAGTLAGSFASISDAHIPTAYFWPLLCLVLFARTRTQWVLLLVLSALSLLLQELYVLLAPILALAAFLRARRESSTARRRCLVVLAMWFLVVALAQAIFIVVQPFSAENRDSLITTVIGLKWLVLGKTINVPAALGVLLILFGGAAGRVRAGRRSLDAYQRFGSDDRARGNGWHRVADRATGYRGCAQPVCRSV